MAVSRSIIITDPVHQVMSFGTDERLRAVLKAVIDTATFQRLRRISQLGLGQNVFPGATHTRFAHGLGAAYLALKALAHLEERHREKSISEPRLEVLAAALLHDVGHGPFSHSFEQALQGLNCRSPLPLHEDWTRAAVELRESEIRKALEANGVDIAKVGTAFRKNPDDGPLPKYFRQLVSSQIDVDRMDYLVRDSHFAGVALGRVDIYYLIHCLTIIEHDGKSLCSLGLEEKGVKAYEGFALARQLMNRTVYYHRAVKVFEFMMEELLRRVIREFEVLDSDATVRQALPKYLRAFATAVHEPLIGGEEEFIAANWKNYFELSETDIWYLLTKLAVGTAVPKRTEMMARMILRREKLPYWLILPGMVGILREKLSLDGFEEGEDCAVIDLSTTVYKQHKDQVFVMQRGGQVAEVAAVSELLTMLRDREERTSLLIVLDPEKASEIYRSGTCVRALPSDEA